MADFVLVEADLAASTAREVVEDMLWFGVLGLGRYGRCRQVWFGLASLRFVCLRAAYRQHLPNPVSGNLEIIGVELEERELGLTEVRRLDCAGNSENLEQLILCNLLTSIDSTRKSHVPKAPTDQTLLLSLALNVQTQ